MSMPPKRLIVLLVLLLCFSASASLRAQEAAESSQPEKSSKSEPPQARARNGKKLLSALDLMKIATVAAPRISPDGSRVAYTVAEVKMEKDKEWKSVTQVWVVPSTGGKAMQFTRGDKSSPA